MSARDDAIAIKGIREGLLITLTSDESWDALADRLLARIDENQGFFKGARVALDLGGRPVLPHEMERIKLGLQRREITVWAIISSSGTTQKTAREMRLETALVAASEGLEAPEVSSEVHGAAGMFLNQTLRNGRTVRFEGHVTVFGDVNPGAEIIAGGNVIVWGRIRGLVHAGALGDETAFVCALDLAPTQLRIAGYITVSPPEKRRRPRPEIALVRGGRIIAESWEG
ncbi:MAG TPA: septum site-determining protein MinC [Aggregatilineales bacterium]|nr:septum site-determining protein MinC [Anaerolineales bacterium]HRE48306.1 septum site-determining protein MinC [Aggregatilineales bacterium]